MLHSLFESVSVDIGRNELNRSSKYYPWKAYMIQLLSYNSEAKSTWMDQMGWYDDTNTSHLHPVVLSNNQGFKERRSLFLTDDQSSFSDQWVPFTGRLCLDLESLKTGKQQIRFNNILSTMLSSLRSSAWSKHQYIA